MPRSIHPDTKIGTVALTISKLDRELAFYQDVLGFQVHRRAGDTAYLGAGGPDLLVLTQHPGAELVPGTTGLHHFAILLPSRLALALCGSAGGYHGHVGVNTWDGVDAPPPPSGSIGLRYFDVRLPNTVELDRVTKQVRDAGVTLEETPAGVLVHDPCANALLLTTSAHVMTPTQKGLSDERG